jgi:hypothetical protein
MYYIRCIGAQRPYSPGSSDLLDLVRSVLDDGDNGSKDLDLRSQDPRIQGPPDPRIPGSKDLRSQDPRIRGPPERRSDGSEGFLNLIRSCNERKREEERGMQRSDAMLCMVTHNTLCT